MMVFRVFCVLVLIYIFCGLLAAMAEAVASWITRPNDSDEGEL